MIADGGGFLPAIGSTSTNNRRPLMNAHKQVGPLPPIYRRNSNLPFPLAAVGNSSQECASCRYLAPPTSCLQLPSIRLALVVEQSRVGRRFSFIRRFPFWAQRARCSPGKPPASFLEYSQANPSAADNGQFIAPPPAMNCALSLSPHLSPHSTVSSDLA